MESSLGWTLHSRDALKRAETLARNNVQGVRDEIGFLALHQAYANRFFPGTPVLHTQVHYFLFMRWICQSLTGRCALSQNSEAIAEDRKSKLR